MSRGKNCLPTIFGSQLPSPKLSPKMPPKLSPAHKRGHFSSPKITAAVRVIATQLRDKNCLAAIFAPRHQDVSSGPLGKKSYSNVLSMPNMTGRLGYRTMEMKGGTSAPYLARTPCVPLFCTLFNRGGNRRAFRLPGAGGDHVHCTAEPSPGHVRLDEQSGGDSKNSIAAFGIEDFERSIVD